MRLSGLICLFGLGASACSAPPSNKTPADIAPPKRHGLHPNIVIGDVPETEQDDLQNWIDETIALLQSQRFEKNYLRASQSYPRLYVSKSQDIIQAARLLSRLKREDPVRKTYWWPKTYLVLRGDAARQSEDRNGFGFIGDRRAVAGPFPKDEVGTKTGQIELGRLHFARYTQGDVVEKSCAMNTMAHEISHTLSERSDQYWMHILDSEDNVTPPTGVFEASYFIGVVAQCTYLESKGRITDTEFQSCLLTFSNPGSSSRFRSRACDDFPGDTPITPNDRLTP